MCHDLFNHFLVDKHLEWFEGFATMNSAAIEHLYMCFTYAFLDVYCYMCIDCHMYIDLYVCKSKKQKP